MLSSGRFDGPYVVSGNVVRRGLDACGGEDHADDAHGEGFAGSGAFGEGRGAECAPPYGSSGSGGGRSRGGRPDSGDGSSGGWRLGARYNAEGPEGLRNRPRGGSVCFLEEKQLSVVRGWVEAGPDPERDEVVRWRVRDIRRKIEEAFGVAYADESVCHLLRREGLGRLSCCPEHPRGDAGAREAFRSEFWVRVRARVREMLGSSALSKPVRA